MDDQKQSERVTQYARNKHQFLRPHEIISIHFLIQYDSGAEPFVDVEDLEPEHGFEEEDPWMIRNKVKLSMPATSINS